MPKNLIQAYQQAPWRVQIQRIGLFLLFLVTSALIAGVYLYFSAQTTAVGVEIWRLEATQEATHFEIENLQNVLAEKSSVRSMEEWAKDLNFDRYTPDEVEYMVIPGYYGRQTAQMGPTGNFSNAPDSIIKPAYTQSLWEWLLEKLLKLSSQ
ncbi:MAG: hypothetical protein K8R77_05640 [Anaerolineaceae bacterium]|nr:hypothetical protein [Anaerolineaceae bacterium]